MGCGGGPGAEGRAAGCGVGLEGEVGRGPQGAHTASAPRYESSSLSELQAVQQPRAAGAAAPGLLGLSRCPPPPGDTPRTPHPPQAGLLGLPHLLGASFVRFAVGHFPSEADLAFPKPKSPSHVADRPDPGLLGFCVQLSQQSCPRVRVRLRGLLRSQTSPWP